MIEAPIRRHKQDFRPGNVRPLVMTALAIAVALWAQSFAREPQVADALILFAAATALLVLAGRRVGEPDAAQVVQRPASVAAPHAAPPLLPGEQPVRAPRFAGAGKVFARRPAGIALLVAGLAGNAYALGIFRGGAPSAYAFLIYLASVVLALVGLWLLSARGATAGTIFPARQRPLSTRRELLLFGLVMLVGIFFRVYRLDAQPAGFWYDEAMLGLEAERVLRGEIFPLYFVTNGGNGALIIYLTAASIELLGSGALAVRLVAVLSGILAIPALYLFVRLLFGQRTALVAALLLAVLRWHTNVSRLTIDAILVPPLALLVFYFLFRGLRSGRTMDFVWAGAAAGLGLNTYPSFRLVPLIAGCYVLHKVVFERRLRSEAALGLGVLLLATVLVASPFLQFYAQNPQIVNGRAETVNLLAGKSGEAAVQAVVENTRKHLLMFNRDGDRNGRHNIPGEPMLDYVTGALFVVGLGYSLYRVRRPEYAFLLVWFLAMLAAGIFSLDFEAPQGFRASGVIPGAIIFAAIPLDRLLRASDGMGRVLPGAVAAGVLVLLAYAGYLNYNDYFTRQATNFASWADFSTAQTLMAEEMRALGPDWQFHVTSIYYDHPTVRFLAPGIRAHRRIDASDSLPIREDGGKKVALFLDAQKASLFAQAKRYYPNARHKEFRPPFGGPPVLFEVQLLEDDLRSVQGLVGRYHAGETRAQAPAIERRDSKIDFDWGTGTPLPPPFSVEWSGSLYVADYGVHLLGVRSPGPVEVWLDENLLLKGSGEEQRVRLAKGDHTLQVRAVVPQGAGRTELYWQPVRGGKATVPQSALYAPPVSNNGLLGSFYRGTDWSGEPALQQIDPSLSLYFHVTPLPRPYTVEWLGKVEAPVAGEYRFGLESIDDSWLEIDGKKIVEAHVGNRYEEGRVPLAAGWHDVRVRYVDKSGYSHINLFWTPPGGDREIIPANRLLPPLGSYPVAGSDKPASAAPPSAPANPPAPPPAGVVPTAGGATVLMKFGAQGSGPGELSEPKDLVLAPDGSVYVADTGNSRIVRFDREGRFRAVIGGPGNDPGQLDKPLAVALTVDGDVLVLDEQTGYISRFAPDGTFRYRFGGPAAGFFHPRAVAVGPDDTVYVADTGLGRVVAFAPDGAKLRELGGKGDSPGQMLGPVGLAVDVEGMLWLADVDNSRVQRLSPAGQYMGSFAIPRGGSVDGAHLALGTHGVYLTDPTRDRILFYSFDGRLLAHWGERGEGEGQFRRPVGIAVDQQGNVWVAERDNHRVQKFLPPR